MPQPFRADFLGNADNVSDNSLCEIDILSVSVFDNPFRNILKIFKYRNRLHCPTKPIAVADEACFIAQRSLLSKMV